MDRKLEVIEPLVALVDEMLKSKVPEFVYSDNHSDNHARQSTCSNIQIKDYYSNDSFEHTRYMDNSSDLCNPNTVNLFVQEYGIVDWQSLLYQRQRESVDDKGIDYLSLRDLQNKDWAISCANDGIAAARKGNDSSAMRKYNAALDMDPKCVDALVARGAMLANQGRLDRALVDLKHAVLLNPRHENASRYLKRTQDAIAKEDQEKKAILRGEFLMPANYDPGDKNASRLNSASLPTDKYSLIDDPDSSDYEGPKRPHTSNSDSNDQSRRKNKHKHKKKHKETSRKAGTSKSSKKSKKSRDDDY
ncbi:hypothetical protein QVD99_006318 [Batrachochytrium dendrobatidis]|nr:hypothetical protein O5D80_003337 [Batrachochytrium dendrobatidis]KAK5667105.1 hypothetical protein QVD99_006318 [Batrachochytrium dendrobatidis]